MVRRVAGGAFLHELQTEGGALSVTARIVLSVAALVMLHWSASAPGPGWLGAGEAGARTIERTEPAVLADAGRPVAAKQRQAEEPFSASAGKYAPGSLTDARSLAGHGDPTSVRQPDDGAPIPTRMRVFDARGPPRRA